MKQVAGYIERETMLYRTKVEYGDFAMNHVQGCAHGCKYPCYAFLNQRRWKRVEDYDAWTSPYLVTNTLQLLAKEINRYRHEIKSVQLCFTTDPFMYEYPEIAKMSFDAITMLNNAGIKCTVLTKGVLPTDLACLSKENEYGISLVSLDERYRQVMEPGAAPYAERIAGLKMLHDMGCKTWISIEPFPFLEIGPDNLEQILNVAGIYTKKIVFGKINHYKGSTLHNNFYNAKSQQVINSNFPHQ